jgi:hypothetical protein
VIEALSPQFRKCLALLLLGLLVWMLVNLITALVGHRLTLHREVNQFREQYLDVMARRVDIASLEQAAKRMDQTVAIIDRAIAADNERAAYSQLQQLALLKLKQSGGSVISINEAAATKADGMTTVGIQFRGRISEPAIAELLAALEASADIALWLDEVTVVARQQGGKEIEITSLIRAPWIRRAGRLP